MFQAHSFTDIMDCHAKHCSLDDAIHLPAHGKAWRYIRHKWIEFKSEL